MWGLDHPLLREPPKLINMWEHTTWGNKIQWLDWNARKLAGWLTPRPTIGTEVRSKMQSGKIARFKIVEITRMRDPEDMFFATCKDLGYLQGDSDAL